MMNQSTTVPLLKGLEERQPQLRDALSELENWTIDFMSGGWSNRLGYERYFLWRNDWSPFSVEKIDSLFYFAKHQGALDSIIIEQGGSLYQLYEFDSTPKKRVISENRSVPTINEVGTQFQQFGKFLFFVNGRDKAGKFIGKTITGELTDSIVVYPFGFQSVPPSPTATGVETDPASALVGNKSSIWFLDTNEQGRGLGSTTSGDKNSFQWKVSFVTNTGCESPLSSPSEKVSWTTAANLHTFAVPIDLPLGDNDIVARRLYRTLNQEQNDDPNYYFVAQINNNSEDLFFDDLSDNSLGSLAPDPLQSIIMPSMSARYLGVYKDCLFCDGGVSNETVLFYSNPSQPDTFSALDFIDVRSKEGGSITGLFGYFNFLLVFRERSIEIVRGDYPNFIATPLIQYVGTRATNTITSVPGVGILFLSDDGVYAVSGNLEYGAAPSIQNISYSIQRTMQRLNKDAIAKASAVYSEKWREWICFFPSDGAPENNMAIVYHIDNNQWSIRKDFPASCLIKNNNGDVIFGYNEDSSGDDPRGLFVMSHKRAAGHVKEESGMVDNDPVTSIMASTWLDFGDSTVKKKIHHVYLLVATGGDYEISLDYQTDYQYHTTTTTKTTIVQPTDIQSQNTYDTIKLDRGLKWEEPLYTAIRFDVHSRACSTFRWKLETNKDMIVVGYMIDYSANNQRTLQGKSL